LSRGMLIKEKFKIFDELMREGTSPYGAADLEDLALIEDGIRPSLAAIFADRGDEGATTFQSRPISFSFYNAMKIKYSRG
jgi:hypothetical protein